MASSHTYGTRRNAPGPALSNKLRKRGESLTIKPPSDAHDDKKDGAYEPPQLSSASVSPDKPPEDEEVRRIKRAKIASPKKTAAAASRSPSSTSSSPKAKDEIVQILATNADAKDEEFTVKWRSGKETKVKRATLSEGLLESLADDIEKAHIAFNMKHEPGLTTGDRIGVTKVIVSQRSVKQVAEHLQENWRDGKWHVTAKPIEGFTTYDKVIGSYDAEEQKMNTLFIHPPAMPNLRKHVPGFLAMEKELLLWLTNRYNHVVETNNGHVLRQGPRTLGSTTFSVHQDTEEEYDIEYTIVVKLTADAKGEPPSEMMVLGGKSNFKYGAAAGSAGCFKAKCYHSSVQDKPGRKEHLKIAFFFKKDERGEARAKRAAERSGGGEALAKERMKVIEEKIEMYKTQLMY